MSSPPPVAALAAYIAFLALQRFHELRLSARNTRRLIARGAIEHGRGDYPLIVGLHVLFPIALTTEVLALGARPTAAWALWLAVLLVGLALRAWSQAALGELWTARVWVVPGTVPVRHGPYRFMSHPSYVAVALELLAAPLLFGAWRTALLCSVFNAALLARRIRVENRALAPSRASTDH